MPWCPKCRVEYIEGIKSCGDCICELVDELPPEKPPDITAGELVPVVTAWDNNEAARLKRLLEDAGIPSIRANAEDIENWVKGIALLVPEQFAKRALTVLHEDDMSALSGSGADGGADVGGYDEAGYDDGEEIGTYINQGKGLGTVIAVALFFAAVASAWFIYKAILSA